MTFTNQKILCCKNGGALQAIHINNINLMKLIIRHFSLTQNDQMKMLIRIRSGAAERHVTQAPCHKNYIRYA